MNLPNKITVARIILSVIILVMLCFPFEIIGFEFPKYIIDGTLTVDLKYLIACVLFIIASATDFIDGNIARKRGIVTDFGKVMDAIADKILVNSVLIILSAAGFISPIIHVIVIVRDSVVNSIKMILIFLSTSASWSPLSSSYLTSLDI